MSRPAAFTLVELLVVIGIIAVLLGLLLSTLARVRQAANNVRCPCNLRQIAQALRMYTNENGDRLPFAYMRPEEGRKYGYPTFDRWGPDWTYLLAPYLGSNETVGHKQGHREHKALNDADTIEPTFVADWFDAGAVSHYTAHAKLFGYNPLRVTQNGFIYKPYRLSEIKRSTEIVMIWDSPQLGDAWGPTMDGVYAADAQADMLGDTDVYAPLLDGVSAPLPVPVRAQRAQRGAQPRLPPPEGAGERRVLLPHVRRREQHRCPLSLAPTRVRAGRCARNRGFHTGFLLKGQPRSAMLRV